MTIEKDNNIENELVRLENILEIQKLQHKYQQWNALFRGDRMLELFARKVPDVSVEAGAPGVYEGYDKVKQFFACYQNALNAKDMLIEHHVTCPVIVVADNGNSAKGTWFAPGIGGNSWAWGKYSCDYIKEDEIWKFWHLRWFPTFMVPFDKGLIPREIGIKPSPLPQHQGLHILDHGEPNKPITYRKPYNPDETNYILPEPPEHYDTYGK